ncbi:hypothetical protein M3Y97_00361400 [Aphelenchoides bicaudatus]|nr:hypothetical protein M3Y97_00361400 [Aphelenchoides bicaudatus]
MTAAVEFSSIRWRYRRNSFVIPYNLISMSEINVLSNTLNSIQVKGPHCTCSTDECFYKFGFAFLNKVEPLPNRTVDKFDIKFCPSIPTTIQLDSTRSSSTDEILTFAQEYARIIRERNFHNGLCGEEILILVVKEVPTGLFWKSSTADYSGDYFYRPRMFVSFGSMAIEKFGVTDSQNGASFINEPLQKIINEENLRLQNGYPIVQVLNSVVARIDSALRETTQSQEQPQARKHVPIWAWYVFGTCGVLFALMAVGLYLLRSQNRRSTFRPNTNERSKWKAGFVGEESQPTYANFVSQMMASAKQQTSSQQQVV